MTIDDYMNTLFYSFDIEDYFMANCFDKQLKRSQWLGFESKIEYSFQILLDLLEEKNIKATLFFLGFIGKSHSKLVKIAHSKGHEIASHGYHHELVYNLSPNQFDEDIKKSTYILEDLIGEKILGYRAPSFSLDINDLRYTDVLEKYGIKYDSSVFPNRFKSRTKINTKKSFFLSDNLMEIPLSSEKLFGINFPLGGAYFRLYPKGLNRLLFKRHLEKNNLIYYLHPWELLDSHPFYPKNQYLKFKHTYNIGNNCKRKFLSIKEFNTGLMRELLS